MEVSGVKSKTNQTYKGRLKPLCACVRASHISSFNIAFINRVVPTFGKIRRAFDLLPVHGREGGWDGVEDFLAVVALQGPFAL